MKRIKGITRKFHKLAMRAVADYFGQETNLNVLKVIEGEKVTLNEEEKSAVWAIRVNMGDETYCKSLPQ